MLIFWREKKRTVVPYPLPLTYSLTDSLYAFINVDNCERPLKGIMICGENNDRTSVT